MSYLRLVLIAGFAMFSMFFGSGNLVFPLLTGVQSQGHFGLAAIGLLITGVVVPFIGLLAMIYYSGNRALFLKALGGPMALFLTFSMLGLLGPFAVVPRCAIVAQGSLSLLWSQIPPFLLNAAFCVITLILAWKRSKIIDIIGRILTPGLLLGIFILIGFGLFMGPPPLDGTMLPSKALTCGIIEGYKTMDLLAAFFFSASTVAYIASALKTHADKQNLERLSLNACLIGAFLLGLVYIGFVALGAKYAPVLHHVDPEKLLVVIAQHSLGALALPLASLVIALACLTTATILTSLFADFFYTEILKEKLSRHSVLVGTIVISYIISLAGFTLLGHWIEIVLAFAYPALIVYTISAIVANKTGYDLRRFLFWVTLGTTVLIKIAVTMGLF